MEITVTVIKADIGSIGGHTLPSPEVLEVVREHVWKHKGRLFVDGYVSHTGDDIAVLLTHTRGTGDPDIHGLVWEAFRTGSEKAKEQGLYGAGQDLLKDAFSGNVRGLGPACAEMTFEERPSESIMVWAADKTEPGAFNLPLYLTFADPMYGSGLLLSRDLHAGFRFVVMDVDHTEGDRVISLDVPERLYDLAALLRDTHRFVVESIWSRTYPGEQAVAVSTRRLRNIAGRYVGKDDPVAIVRVQNRFPATEEFGPPLCPGALRSGGHPRKPQPAADAGAREHARFHVLLLPHGFSFGIFPPRGPLEPARGPVQRSLLGCSTGAGGGQSHGDAQAGFLRPRHAPLL